MSLEQTQEGLQASDNVEKSNPTPEVKTQTQENIKTVPEAPLEENKEEEIVEETSNEVSEQKIEETTEKADIEVSESSEQVEKEAVKIEIPEEDYTSLSQEDLLGKLKKLVEKYPVQLIKNQVEEIRSIFNSNFDKAAKASKEEFLAEGGNEIDFYYTTPLKREFNDIYFNYKDKRNKYYKAIQTNLENNLKVRQGLIEQLKALVADTESSVSKKFKGFNEIKENWHEAGAIPRDQNNVVWNTFYHHVDRFYEVVHLDREFRDKHFKHNLEQKIMIIDRAKELLQETSINRAFQELQVLHRIWKEEIGPVAKEYKEVIWEKFSELTKEIHDKRHEFFAEQDSKQEENLVKRKEIILKIGEITAEPKSNHNDWQKAMKQVEELHEAFKASGRVPSQFKNSIWDEFREAERTFNRAKNEFYKGIKGEQLENLAKKIELIALAEANKDSEDFEVTTPLMKKIQSDWKRIGHVPRKDSDKVWNQFKEACNYYFDRVHNKREEANKGQEEAFEKKTSFIEAIKEEAIETIEDINAKISEWKTLGTVPFKKRKIEEEFSKVLDNLFGKLNINKQESELIKFETKIAELQEQDDPRLINSEKSYVRKKMDEVKSEILQLQNNLQFFKHADKSNPLVADVYKRIAKFEDDLETWKLKWQKIKSL